MAKFHINKHGVPAPCKATKGNCPLGGDSGNENHFNTAEEAQAYVDEINEGEHGYLAKVVTFKDQINNIKAIEDDFSQFIPTLNPNSEVAKKRLEYDWDLRDFKESQGLDENEFRTHLKTYNINVSDLDTKTQEERDLLGGYLVSTTSRKIGNLSGFLNSNKDTSYNKSKVHSKDGLNGSYDEVLGAVKMVTNVGWHKSSSQGVAHENTALNKMMDRKGLIIAGDIARYSSKNQETKSYPASGLIASVQALRAKGWNETQIKNIAIDNRLDDVVYEVYDEKPRDVSGACEIERILTKNVDDKHIHSNGYKDLAEDLKERFNWTE